MAHGKERAGRGSDWPAWLACLPQIQTAITRIGGKHELAVWGGGLGVWMNLREGRNWADTPKSFIPAEFLVVSGAAV